MRRRVLAWQSHSWPALDVELLHSNGIEPFDDVACHLVVEVEPRAPHAIVPLREQDDRLASPIRAALSATNFALGSLETARRALVMSRVIDQLAVAERCECRDAEVDSDIFTRGGKRLDRHIA